MNLFECTECKADTLPSPCPPAEYPLLRKMRFPKVSAGVPRLNRGFQHVNDSDFGIRASLRLEHLPHFVGGIRQVLQLFPRITQKNDRLKRRPVETAPFSASKRRM